MNQQRIVFIDYIRIIACFLVMLVHASENFYAADASGLAGNVSMLANESNRFWVAFYDGFVGRTCVPLFMIVSAFLLVPMKPGQTMTQFYHRRFMRILPPFLAFTRFQELIDLTIKYGRADASPMLRSAMLEELCRLRELYCKAYLERNLAELAAFNRYFDCFA